MAKKFKTRRRKSSGKKTTTRRRRRVGAVALLNPSGPLVMYAPILLGYLMADKVNAPIAKLVGDKLDPKIVAGAEAGLGALLVFSKGKKSLLKSLAGGLLLGAGVKSLMASFGMGGIGPYGNVPVVGAIGPYGRVPVVGRRRVDASAGGR